MNFIEKKIAYDELFGASHIEADKQLLQKLAPQHKVLSVGIFETGRYAADLLWALLDLAHRDDIVKNRRAFVAAQSELDTEEAEAKRLADEEAEAKRLADEEAEAKRLADEEAEAKRLADEKAEAKRLADEEAEAKRLADEKAESKKKAGSKNKNTH